MYHYTPFDMTASTIDYNSAPPPQQCNHHSNKKSLKRHPTLWRLRSCYKSALKLLHVRANRRVVPLALENTSAQEQFDRSVTAAVTNNNADINVQNSSYNNNNGRSLPQQHSAIYTESMPSSTVTFSSSMLFPTTSPQRQKEDIILTDEEINPKKATATYIPTSRSANAMLNKVLTRTKSTSRSLVTMASSSEKSSQRHHFAKLQQKHFRIYTKAPHYAAGGQVSGSIVVNLPQHYNNNNNTVLSPLSDPLDGIEGFTFRLIGIEDIHDQANYNPATHTHQFLDLPIFNYDQDALAECYNRAGVIKIPFTLQLPVDLGASYADKKARVRYLLQTEMTLDCPTPPTTNGYAVSSRPLQRIIKTDRSIVIYPNVMSRPLSDAKLYMPIDETRHVWQSPILAATCSVELQVMLSRTIWIAGTPIYLGFKIHNMSKQKISSVKLELLRRQNTFSQTGLSGSFGLMPVTSTCEVVARINASSFDWWQPIEQGLSDQVTLAIQSPLIDVSYSIRVSISSTTSTDAVLEVPVILVHPVSMDPPPSNYLQGDNSTETKDAYRRLCVDIFRETTPISNSSSESDVPSLESRGAKNTSSRKSSSSSLASSIKPFQKMRRNISQWIFNNSNHNSHQKKSITTTATATTTIPNTVVVPVSNSQFSPVRHGNVRSPKQFGAEPDSIGDAGLDIRHKLNVATAREVWEGYKAEQCSLPRITLVSPPPERSVSLPSRWKAPSQKLEISSSFNLFVEKEEERAQEKMDIKAQSSATTKRQDFHHYCHHPRYPLNAQKGIKRMLASSRYMKSLQSKTLSVTEDGRKLLALSAINDNDKNERRSAIAV
ncbi:hypothetical protein INT45_002153 [Circinella minor]|uniref:Arrestin C-terminal-like domain-containing protein n=1 Tax=Circinella minor TaxID=1195481 RepID=A0A8H7VP70_9FUNG|nr:hypothetical protein INT45_002153 [Circinella minor]